MVKKPLFHNMISPAFCSILLTDSTPTAFGYVFKLDLLSLLIPTE